MVVLAPASFYLEEAFEALKFHHDKQVLKKWWQTGLECWCRCNKFFHHVHQVDSIHFCSNICCSRNFSLLAAWLPPALEQSPPCTGSDWDRMSILDRWEQIYLKLCHNGLSEKALHWDVFCCMDLVVTLIYFYFVQNTSKWIKCSRLFIWPKL